MKVVRVVGRCGHRIKWMAEGSKMESKNELGGGEVRVERSMAKVDQGEGGQAEWRKRRV